MDVSKQTVNEANITGVSMYLSFDSSMSSAAFKTLEASANDVSMLSNTEPADGDSTAENSQDGWHQDSTLEAQDHSHTNYLNSVKKMEEALSPLRAFPKNILQEHKGACSTPTKEQLLRSVAVTRGCDMDQCFGLDIGGAKPANNLLLAAEDDKENAQPRTEHISNSLVVSVVDIVKTTTNTAAKEEKIEKLTTIKEVQEITEEKTDIAGGVVVEATSKPIAEKIAANKSAATVADFRPLDGKRNVDIKLKSSPKLYPSAESTAPDTKLISLGKNNIRKSVCAPNLQANRPSRIVPKRSSPSNAGSKARADLSQAASDIPKLLNRILKISSNAKADATDSSVCKLPGPVDKGKCTVGAGGGRNRPSLLPAPQAEKRPFTFPQRMSVVVRTTLNSPARKVARRSVLPTAQHTRRSVATAKATSDANMPRRSVLPMGKSSANAARAVKFDQKATNWKSDHSSDYPSMKPTTTTKSEPCFMCSFCGATFRVKSLLDAHKRSHEDGVPAFARKSAGAATAGTSATSSMNKCKYCDKQFALLRALHIHLMQNCPKIPPSEKRKLEFTEMNHVEKAQLPSFFHAKDSSSSVNSMNSSSARHGVLKMPPPRTKSNLSSISISSTESASERAFSDVTMIAHKGTDTIDDIVAQMAPPSINKVKKKTAHAGVYRTPNKAITCHMCKTSFKTIMDHIDHNMAVHFMQAPPDNGSGSGDHASGSEHDQGSASGSGDDEIGSVSESGSASASASASGHDSASGNGSDYSGDLRAVDDYAD